uniref:Peptidase S1 domain-containing protein n=1 Tax=Timema monikensis TaxID=170555 RepID=A0A7R9EIW7_9NEOP|nr:unnamed protein product [Timema monikensis]
MTGCSVKCTACREGCLACSSFSASSLLVRAGTANRYVGGVTRRVSLVKEHSQYNIGARWNNDVALIRVYEAFPLGPSIQPIALAASDLLLSEGTYTRVAGWGATWVTVTCNIHQGGGLGSYLSPESEPTLSVVVYFLELGLLQSGGGGVDNLLQVDLPLWTNAQCAQIFDNGRLTDEMVCAGYIAGGKDTCQVIIEQGEEGDSGGALSLEGVQVGVVSWGSVCAEYPGVYARVSRFRNWITSISGNPARLAGTWTPRLASGSREIQWVNKATRHSDSIGWYTSNETTLVGVDHPEGTNGEILFVFTLASVPAVSSQPSVLPAVASLAEEQQDGAPPYYSHRVRVRRKWGTHRGVLVPQKSLIDTALQFSTSTTKMKQNK